MPTLEPPPINLDFDELTQLELGIAQRADELLRHDAGQHPNHNFWQEAESEVWCARLRILEPALTG